MDKLLFCSQMVKSMKSTSVIFFPHAYWWLWSRSISGKVVSKEARTCGCEVKWTSYCSRMVKSMKSTSLLFLPHAYWLILSLFTRFSNVGKKCICYVQTFHIVPWFYSCRCLWCFIIKRIRQCCWRDNIGLHNSTMMYVGNQLSVEQYIVL